MVPDISILARPAGSSPAALGGVEWPMIRPGKARGPRAEPMTRYENQSIDRVFRIMEVLGRSPYYYRLAEIARRCELAPPTAFRLLSVMARLGYVNKDAASSRYGLGSRLYRLAHRETHLRSLVRLAQPRLQHLSAQTGETVHVGAFDGTQVVIRGRIAAPSRFRLPTRVGMRLDAHATALGKAMLAARPPAEVADIFMNHVMAGHTPRTVRSLADLESELAEARKRGYATSFGELFEGVHCVAAPVLNSLGHGNIAVSVGGPAAQMTPRRLEKFGRLVRSAAAAIQKSLLGTAERIGDLR